MINVVGVRYLHTGVTETAQVLLTPRSFFGQRQSTIAMRKWHLTPITGRH